MQIKIILCLETENLGEWDIDPNFIPISIINLHNFSACIFNTNRLEHCQFLNGSFLIFQA